MFGSLGMGELLVILVIVLVLFGANRIPQLMGGLGEGLKSFKKAIKDDEKDHQASVSEKDKEKDKIVR